MRAIATMLVCALVVACGEDDPAEAARVLASPDAGATELEPEADAGAMAVPQGDAGAELADGSSATPADAAVDPEADGGELADASTAADAAHDAGPAQRRVSYGQMESIVLSTCRNCHTPFGSQPYVLPNLITLANAYEPMSNCNGQTYVVPGDVAASYLYTKLLPGAPCGQHVAVPGLTAEKLSMFRDWILTGATED